MILKHSAVLNAQRHTQDQATAAIDKHDNNRTGGRRRSITEKKRRKVGIASIYNTKYALLLKIRRKGRLSELDERRIGELFNLLKYNDAINDAIKS